MEAADFSQQTVFDHNSECSITLPCLRGLPGHFHILSHLYFPVYFWNSIQLLPLGLFAISSTLHSLSKRLLQASDCLLFPSAPASRCHPYLWLPLSTAGRVRHLHPLEHAPARHNKKDSAECFHKVFHIIYLGKIFFP